MAGKKIKFTVINLEDLIKPVNRMPLSRNIKSTAANLHETSYDPDSKYFKSNSLEDRDNDKDTIRGVPVF